MPVRSHLFTQLINAVEQTASVNRKCHPGQRRLGLRKWAEPVLDELSRSTCNGGLIRQAQLIRWSDR